MQTSATPARRNHLGTWIVVIVAILEVAALGAFFAFKDRACGAIDGSQGGAPLRLQLGGGGGNDQGNGGNGPSPSASPGMPATASTPGADQAGTNAGDVKTQGDVNQVPDPNCVAKAAAGLLNAESPPSAAPSCAPMSPPPELKNAEQQVQNGTVTGSSPAPVSTASP